MADQKNDNRRGLGAFVKNAWRKWLTDPNKVEQKELTKTDESTNENAGKENLPAKKWDEWRHYLLDLDLPDYIVKKSELYVEHQKFLARTDEENLNLYEKEKKLTQNKFDKITEYSFWGSAIALGIGGLCIWIGVSPMFWAALCGVGAASTYVFDRLAHQVHLQQIELERKNSLEECEDELNKYAYLLVEAVNYINGQIALWNMRNHYLNENLTEVTDQDRNRCANLMKTRKDFEGRIKQLAHLYNLKQLESLLTAKGLDLERLNNKLDEHLPDLKPIVPKIATDPLMLEAIRDADAIFTENSDKELSEKIENLKAILEDPQVGEKAEIVIEEDAENK